MKPANLPRAVDSEGLSRAVVSRLVGSADGLSSERDYVSSVLPHGVGRGFTDLLRVSTPGEPRWSGPLRSVAIVLGLAATSAGDASARVRARLGLVRNFSEAPTSGSMLVAPIPLRHPTAADRGSAAAEWSGTLCACFAQRRAAPGVLRDREASCAPV